MLFVVVHVGATKMFVLCVGFCVVQEKTSLPMHTHTHITDISQSSLTLWKNALQIRERGSEGMTYLLALYYIRLQSHVAS